MPRVRRHRAPLVFYVVAIIAFAILAAAAVLWARGYTIDFAGRSVYKTGLLVLRSNPSGAYVTINSHLRKQDTPQRVKLRAGSYHVKVDKPGSRAFEQDVQIEAEHAVFLDHITLWQKKPSTTRLASQVVSFAVAPNQRQFAYLQTVTGGTALWVSSPGDQPVRLATLPAAYRVPTTLAFASDGGALVAATAKESTLIPLTGTTTHLGVGGQVVFAPGRRDAVLVRRNNQLLRFAKVGRTMVADKVSAWSITPEATYVVSGQTVTRIDQQDSRRVVSRSLAFADLHGASQTDFLFARDRGGSLYSLDPSGKNELIAGPVSAFRASPDAARLAYVSDFELHLWQRRDQADNLVTRFTSAPTDPWATAEGYDVLYRQGSSFRTITATGASDQELVKLPATSPATLLEGSVLLRRDGGILSLQSLQAR